MNGHAAAAGGGRASQPETAEMTSLPSSRTTAHYPPTLTHRLPPPRRAEAEMKAQRRASLPASSPSPLVPVARPRSTTATMTAMRVATSSPSSTAVAALPRSPQATQPSVVPLPPMGKPVRRPCNPPAQPSFPESPKQAEASEEKVADFLTAVAPRSKSPRTSPAYIVETTAVAPSSVMNGYEVPDLVQSAGGLQSLIFMFDHRDGENSSAAAAAPLLDLADFSFSTPAPPTGSAGDGDSNVNGGGGARKQQRGSAEQTGEKAVPMVQARVPANIAPRFQVSSYGDVADDWYNLASTDAGDGESTVKAAHDGDKDTTSATESANQSDSLTDTRTSLSGGDTPSDSILLPTALRHSRSSEGSTGESIPFHKRVVMRQETDADVQCYHAYEYVLSFFEQRGHDVDEDRSGGGSSRSSQVSRPSSRNRVAVVHGTDFQPKRSLRRIPTEEERRAAFVSRTLRDLYTNVARAYQVAGIPKGYLDALYMVEVLKGAREPRPRSRSNTAANLVSPPSSDEDEAAAQLRSTEEVPADDDLDRALRGAFRPARGRGGRGGGRGRCAGVEGGSAGRRECSSEPAAQSCKRSKGKGNARGGAKEEASEAAASGRRATASSGPQQGNAHAFMLRVLRKNSVHFDYQHNPMPLHTYRALQRSGDVLLNGKTFRLPIWDDEKSGYLVTGVFDRTLSFPKNYRDVLTREIYAEEQKGGVSTSFPLPEMTRQHNAVNARCVSDDSGVTLRGCSIVRHPDVFGIYDGRVQGCQVPRACRDHRRTGMHAAIQSLAHYMNLFSKYPSLVRLLHPQDRYRYPVVNPVGGMYCVPLIINGAARLVKVDDYVPIDPVTGTFRCLTSSANELFPTLLEKALLKANSGGVTLPLMEASHVLHQLCGWIPQTIPFATDPAGNEVMWDGMLYPGEMWDALSAMYQRGRLAMSLVGIWEKEETRATAPSFVRRNLFSRPAHFTVPVSFPVVDLISCVESTAGRATRRIRAVMLRDTTKDPTSADSGPPVPTALSEATLTSLGYSTVHRDAGVFCVTWEEATTCFDHCSVSLCPSTYWSKDALKLRPREPTRICCHDVYDMRNEGKVMFHQPQYHLCFSNVESSSRVFVVYTQHTSMQHPLPWPCEGLTNATVDRCSGGGAAVQLRLYEVTSLPSILQWRREGCGGAGGRSCAFASCVGRRLTGELEGPRPSCVVASALGRANSMVTVAFDVSPGTREYVLVLDVEADATTDAADRMSSFPYTLTMYTSMNVMEQTNPGCVPFVAPRGPSASCGEKSGGKARRSRVRRLGDGGDGQQQQQTLAETATMHAIPAALPVNARTVRGVWGTNRTPKRVAIVKHDLVTEELWTGPQFHLRLSQPDDVFIRLYATSPCSSTSLPSAAVKLLLVRKTTPKSLAVMGYVMGQSDVVLESSGWSTEGAVLDSFSPHTVLLDRKRELTQSPTWTRREFNAVIKLDLYLDPRADVEEASCLLVPHPDPADCVQSLIVHAFAQGMLISPEACEVTCMGSVVPPSVELRRLLSDRTACYTFNAVNGESTAVVEEEGSQSYACREPCLDIFVDVEVLNTSPFMAVHFPENEQSGRLVSRLRTVAKRTLNSGNQQSTKALRALSYISTLIQNSGLAEEKKSFLLGLARGLLDWCTARASSRADVARTSPLMLRQLPAGDYTIVTCFKPTAGTYVRNRDNPRGAPTLVQGGDVEFNVEVQLLRQRVELTAIATTVDPVTREAESHSAQLNEYPANA